MVECPPDDHPIMKSQNPFVPKKTTKTSFAIDIIFTKFVLGFPFFKLRDAFLQVTLRFPAKMGEGPTRRGPIMQLIAAVAGLIAVVAVTCLVYLGPAAQAAAPSELLVRFYKRL